MAHRYAIFVTIRSPKGAKPVGEYKARHVFLDIEALVDLLRDYETAVQAMTDWIAHKAPDLAAEAGRGDAGAAGQGTDGSR